MDTSNNNEHQSDELRSSHPPSEPSETPHSTRKVAWVFSIIGTVILLILIRLYFVNAISTSARQSLPIPVVTALVNSQEMPVLIPALGSVTATETVTVKTQINGQLLRVDFQEGQTVKAGELLAEIDPRPYQAQLLQFEGQLARDLALLANARIDLERYKKLYSQDSVSQQILDTQNSLVNQYEGAVKFDVGQIEAIKLNLSYCRITAPISGRVGLRQVDPGNFVQTTDQTALFVINTIQPITVIFSIPEDNLPKIIEKVNAGNHLKTEAYDRAQNKLLSTGELLTFDNQIDPTTGTIKLKAQFKNEKENLFPNQFVNCRLQVEILKNAKAIPIAAIQRGVKGPFVYLVNPDHTVSVKLVTIQVTNGDTVAISGDILPNQLVVVEGADKLTEGSKVTFSDNSSSQRNTKV